ncbi:hypothetical protein F5Y17DRAFT_451368 [Xylariaceae sp. FL0594]|nr:hypothetical protein F5Y17DRAFT_451368 [Xylariaceae sp. FL0594]
MASLLSRATLLPRSIAANPSISATASPAIGRLFSSTSAAQSQRIPPESPLFINVPNPPQDQSIEAKRELKRIRGFLPVPRQLFGKKGQNLKPTDAWLNSASPAPTSAKSKEPPMSDVEAWRRKMAASRRENLRAGMKALWARHQRLQSKRIASRKTKLAANKAAAMAPEREDERLTRASVNLGTLQTSVAPDPHRFETALASAQRTAAIAAMKSERRRDALQTLYMNARSFIITEEELQAAVQKEFADDFFQSHKTSTGATVNNIWDLKGPPLNFNDMLNEAQRNSDLVVQDNEAEKTRTVKRQKLLAEELTGGQMDRY